MEQLCLDIRPTHHRPMKARYRIRIIPPDLLLPYTLPKYRYEVTDGLDGPVIKRGYSNSIRGWMGAYYAAEKAIKRLMLKERR